MRENGGEKEEGVKKQLAMHDTFIIFGIVLLAAIATYFILFERV